MNQRRTKKKVEGTVLRGGGDEFSVMTVVYPCGMVSVSSLGYFLSVGSLSNPSHPSIPLSFRLHCIQEYLKKKRGRKQKYTNLK